MLYMLFHGVLAGICYNFLSKEKSLIYHFSVFFNPLLGLLRHFMGFMKKNQSNEKQKFGFSKGKKLQQSVCCSVWNIFSFGTMERQSVSSIYRHCYKLMKQI